jgi:eukaryotic-like serine/threonine-protein kinase
MWKHASPLERRIIDSRYEIVRQLGQGGMGAVYEATHLGTGRRVALKVIIAEALASSGGDDIIARFQREARASGKIESQHVVQVLDTGVDRESGCPYLVMEHLTGEDLQQIIRRLGPLAPDAVLRIASHACAGLARAHQEGIIHRDIKAANLFVAQREMGELVVKVLDFGIAKVRADPMSANAQSSITRTGSLLGSPLYMSPEQVVGNKSIDARTDVFSLGVTMYEALSGVPPHHEVETIGALVLAICSGKRESLQSRAFWVPDDVAAIVEKSLALDPADRFQTMTEMQAAIATLLPKAQCFASRC